MRKRKCDVLVIGAGAAGAMAALTAAEAGASVELVARGYGATALSPGVVDVCGFQPDGTWCADPLTGVRYWIEAQPHHPYALLNRGKGKRENGKKDFLPFSPSPFFPSVLVAALERFRRAVASQGLPYAGDPACNRDVATVLGTIKTTCLVPITADLDLARLSDRPLVVVGLRGYHDYDPVFVARSLEALASHQIEASLKSEGAVVELPGLRNRPTLTATEIAYALDDPAMYGELERALESVASQHPEAVLLLPPALGYDRAVDNVEGLRRHLGMPVAEILPNPHSVPGQRLQRALVRALRDAGARMCLGVAALKVQIEDGRCRQVLVQAERDQEAYVANAFVLAGGDLVGGGLIARDGWIVEPLTGAQVALPQDEGLVHPQFLAPQGHGLFTAGLTVDGRLRPLGSDGQPLAENLFAAGSIIGGADRDREGSGMGIAVGTGYVAGQYAATLADGEVDG